MPANATGEAAKYPSRGILIVCPDLPSLAALLGVLPRSTILTVGPLRHARFGGDTLTVP